MRNPVLTIFSLVVPHTSEGQRRPKASTGERPKGTCSASASDEAQAGTASVRTSATATTVPAARHPHKDGPSHSRRPLASYPHGSEHNARPDARTRSSATTHPVRTAHAAAASTTADTAATKSADNPSYGSDGGRGDWDDLVRALWPVIVYYVGTNAV